MQLIAIVDKNWAIGKKGQQLVHIPGDQKVFRQETERKIVVMGRKTLLALPGGRPLDNRKNMILTKDENFQVKGAEVFHSMEDLLFALEEYKKEGRYKEEDIYIIGGQSIYEQFLPYCDTAHITYIDYEYEADTYMVDLEKAGWHIEEVSDEQTYFNLCFEFRKYVK